MKYKLVRLMAFISFVFCVLPFFKLTGAPNVTLNVSVFDIASSISISGEVIAGRPWLYFVPVAFSLVFAFSAIPLMRSFFNTVNIVLCSAGLALIAVTPFFSIGPSTVSKSVNYAFIIVLLGFVGCLCTCIFMKEPPKSKK